MVYSLVIKAAYFQFQQARAARCALRVFNRVQRSAAGAPAPLHGLARPCCGPTCQFERGFSLDVGLRSKAKNSESENRKVTVSRRRGDDPAIPAAQKVKQASKDFTYLIVVVIGIGVTGGLLYIVFKELFSSSSPSKIYGKALEKCRAHPEVIGVFGEPIKGYGETTRRGRRQHVSHVEYIKDGLKHMQLKFYIQGAEPRMQGTVHTEMKENPETGQYEFRYIFVDVDTYPRRTIIVEDNR
uniref:Mitochondrial import inner membrane translocase subunit Tim21 n=1 Tax=Paramormyrops kingsleyae TaxID=1676925 RepID=A0A3B3RRC2_9TELE|nr:mitochondrial import inner membrane translocase subunit Tim21 [Paramormyrops kingsleyae]